MPKLKLQIDWFLVILILILMGIGLVALLSAGGEKLYYRQINRGCTGIVLMLLLSQVPANFIKHGGIVLFVIVLIMLVLVLFVGVKINNAQRWLNLGFFVQPSELMKIFLPLGLAYVYTLVDKVKWWHHFVAIGFVAIPTLLVFKQPDFGTSVLVAVSGLVTIYFAGIRFAWIAGLSTAGLAMLPVLWNVVLKDYQKNRVLTMLDPYKDPLGAGYHTIQSQIAVGSGGLWGKGFREGTQAQLGFLPERHTDFIFAVYAEEFGLVGALVLLALIVLISCRCLAIARKANDLFFTSVTASITMVFFLTAMINLCMVSGLLPVVGMPLPLISYGGTALLATLMGFGVILSVSKNNKSTKQFEAYD